MDLFSIVKFLHVAAAMAWVGGGVTLFALVMFAKRARNEAEMMRLLGSVGGMGVLWFLPASALTLAFGLVMTFLGNLWTELWIVLGLAGLFASFLLGHFVLRVKAIEAGRLMGEGNLPAAAAVGRSILGIAKFDYVVLFTVVADMVLRPRWHDVLTVGVFAVVLAAAAWMFLAPALRSARAQPA